MVRHPYVQPHPPKETCMTCNKPLLHPYHDTPYGEPIEEDPPKALPQDL